MEPRILEGNHDLKYQVFADSSLDQHIISQGVFQDWATLGIGPFIPQNGVIFDIGANVGLLTLPFAKLHVPEGKVYAYEPDSQNFAQLQVNLKLNDLTNAQAFRVALQNDPEIDEMSFYIRRAVDGEGKINRGLSSLENMPNYNVYMEKVSVSTLDQEVGKHQLNRVDFIKVDVEGSEFKVLKGGEQTILKFQPLILYEYSTLIDTWVNYENSRLTFRYLKDLGYRQYQLVAEEYLTEFTEGENLAGVNVLAIHQAQIPQFIARDLLPVGGFNVFE